MKVEMFTNSCEYNYSEEINKMEKIINDWLEKNIDKQILYIKQTQSRGPRLTISIFYKEKDA